MEMVEGGAGAEEPASKWARLESVIPAPWEPPAQPARNLAPVADIKPVATQLERRAEAAGAAREVQVAGGAGPQAAANMAAGAAGNANQIREKRQ
jgi:hypothetical protein